MARRHINLLPPDRREHLRRGVIMRAFGRLVRTGLFSVSVLTVGGVVAGAGLWLAATQTEQTAESAVGVQLSSYRKLRDQVSEKNQLLTSVLQLDTERVVWTPLVHDVLSIIPPGIEIESFSGERDGGTIRLTFTGTAQVRTALVVLENQLEQLPWVLALQAPRSNLLEPVGGPFSFGLTISEEASAESAP